MSEFLNSASDDQLALAICFGAVLGCGLIMHFSLHVGRIIPFTREITVCANCGSRVYTKAEGERLKAEERGWVFFWIVMAVVIIISIIVVLGG